MSLKKLILFNFICFALLFSVSCDKTTTEDFISEKLSDYLPTIEGKYITYRVDSTVFTNFGTVIETHKYQVKHEVDTQITDNLGRPSYRIFRYIRDSAGVQPWSPNGTYFITPLADQIEVIEENFRIIKLHLPLRLNYNWKGNKYLATEPYAPKFEFSNDFDMQEWDYVYDQFESSTNIGSQTVNDVWTVFHMDDSFNAPVTDPGVTGSKTLSIEKYAKSIGLVQRDYVLWEYQPPRNGNPGYYVGFGNRMWMIDHN